MKTYAIALAMLLATPPLLATHPLALAGSEARLLPPEHHPIAGDWNEAGSLDRDELGYYHRPSSTFVLCENSAAPVELSCRRFPLPIESMVWIIRQRAIPVVGRWAAGATDAPALYDPATGHVEVFRYRTIGDCGFHCIAAIVRDRAFALGAGGDYPVAGDWDGNGIDSLGLVHANGSFTLFEDTNAIATTHVNSGFRPQSWTPMAGRWSGSQSSGDSLAFFDSTKGYFVAFDGISEQPRVRFALRDADTIPVPGVWSVGSDAPGLYFPHVDTFACRNQLPCHEVERFPAAFQEIFADSGDEIQGTLNSRYPNDPSG